MAEAFADYLRTSHEKDTDATVTQQVVDALNDVDAALTKLAADPEIDARKRHEVGERAISIQDVKHQNAVLGTKFRDFLAGDITDPS